MNTYAGPNTLLKAFQIIRQALKNNAPSAGDGIKITQTESGPEIRVSLPTRAVTQAEYNALTDSEKQAEVLYAVTDDAPEGGGGGASEEVYSTEETRIGTWIDGKPLYRRVYRFPEKTYQRGVWIQMAEMIPDATAVKLDGSAVTQNGAQLASVPVAAPSGQVLINYATDAASGLPAGISIYINHTSYLTAEYIFILMYTKATDEGRTA